VTVVRMFGVRCVVSAVESAAVVADGVAVVAGAGHAVRVAGQTQSCQGEGDGGAELLAKSLCGGKSLQMNNKNLGKTIQGVSLGALPPCLTGLAGRHLVPVQGLLLGEGIETLVERNISSPGWDAQTEVPERLEGDGLVIAVSTAQGGLQLANKQVNQVGIIPPDVTLPRLHGLLAHT